MSVAFIFVWISLAPCRQLPPPPPACDRISTPDHAPPLRHPHTPEKAKPKKEAPRPSVAPEFAGQYEFYMTDSRFAELRDPKWLIEKDIVAWPTWVLTALNNYAYCKKHGYDITLWATPSPAVSNYSNRGWGNALAAQYISSRSQQGGWPDRDWLIYLDSDSYVRRVDTRVEEFLSAHPMYTPLEAEDAQSSLLLKEEGNTPKALKKARKVVNATEEVFALLAAEVPLPVVLQGIAPDSWVNTGVIFFNLRHKLSNFLLTEWTRSVTSGICDGRFRFDRIAEQTCLNTMFFAKNEQFGYMKHIALQEDPARFNSPVGDYVRHTWGGNSGGFTFLLFGSELISMGYRSTRQIHNLLREMVASGAVRPLPMVLGEKAPAYIVNDDNWDIQTEEMAQQADILVRSSWQPAFSRSPAIGTFLPVVAASSSECLVTAHRDHTCSAIVWRVRDNMRGDCFCYSDLQSPELVTEPFTVTWTPRVL